MQDKSYTHLIQLTQFLAKTLTPRLFSFQITEMFSLGLGYMMLTRICSLMVLPLRTSPLVVLLYGPTRP